MLICVYKNAQCKTNVDITNPGPDTASFPTSPFTLPKGRAYFENFPLYFDLPENKKFSYNWPFLMRIGVTNFLEFRLQGQGLSHSRPDTYQKNILGFMPLNIGIKLHIWGTQEWKYMPSTGIEVYVIPPIASKPFRDKTQFIINSLFNIKLQDSLALEWNIGVYSRAMPSIQKRNIYTIIEWALTQEITKHINLFFEGLYSSPGYPSYPKTLLLGIGFLRNINKRISIYGSYNWPIFKDSSELATLGFALAF